MAEAGEVDLGATIDAGKLWKLTGGVMQVTITERQGEPPPGRLIFSSRQDPADATLPPRTTLAYLADA